MNTSLTAPREGYRGPKLGTGSEDVKEGLLNVYDFNYNNGEVLREKVDGKYTAFQLNSAANYAKFHLVTLLEKHKAYLRLHLERYSFSCSLIYGHFELHRLIL